MPIRMIEGELPSAAREQVRTLLEGQSVVAAALLPPLAVVGLLTASGYLAWPGMRRCCCSST